MDKEFSGTGHLIDIYDKEKKPKGFVFLWVRGVEDSDAVECLPQETSKINDSIREEGFIKEYYVANFQEIPFKHPQTHGFTIETFPIWIFWDRSKQEFKHKLFLIGIKNLLLSRGNFFPSNYAGGVVTGNDFFNREATIEEVWQRLQEKNLLITAPRRFGKTSLLYVIRDNPKEDYRCIHIDLEKVYSPLDFAARCTAAVRAKDEVERNKIEEEIRKTNINWQSKAEEIRRSRLLFLMDEFSYMLDNFFEKLKRKEIEEFLQWFARKREGEKYLRFILTGSIDIEVYIEDKNINQRYFADFDRLKLSPFKEEEAELLVEGLLYGQGVYLEKEIIEEIVKSIHPAYPYFLQIFTGQIISYYRKYKSITVKDIPHIYGGERTRKAEVLLDELSKSPQGVRIAELQHIYLSKFRDAKDIEILLGYLEYDVYLEKKDNAYRFSSPLLREYWKRYQFKRRLKE